MRRLGERAERAGGDPRLDGPLEMALRWLSKFLAHAPPRRVFADAKPPVVLMTDGACEAEGGVDFARVTVGAVLWVPGTSGVRCFGVRVPEHVVAAWRTTTSRQVIAQAELIPVLLARLTWPNELRGVRVLIFVDNNSARFALIKGYSPVLASAEIVGDIWMWDALEGTTPWYERTPSPSNLGDGPSRLDFEEVLAIPGSLRVSPVLPVEWSEPRLHV